MERCPVRAGGVPTTLVSWTRGSVALQRPGHRCRRQRSDPSCSGIVLGRRRRHQPRALPSLASGPGPPSSGCRPRP